MSKITKTRSQIRKERDQGKTHRFSITLNKNSIGYIALAKVARNRSMSIEALAEELLNTFEETQKNATHTKDGKS